MQVVLAGEQAATAGLALAEQLRNQLPQLRLVTNLGGGSFKAQFKRADRSLARFALVVGEDELAQQQITIKDLKGELEQRTVAIEEVAEILATSI